MPYNSCCPYGSILDIASSKQHAQTHNTLSHTRAHTTGPPADQRNAVIVMSVGAAIAGLCVCLEFGAQRIVCVCFTLGE